MLTSMFNGALSNHGCNSEYELWEASGGWDMQSEPQYSSNFKPNPLYYHDDMTNIVDVIEVGEQFTKVKTKTHILLYLSVPNKIIVNQDSKLYIHRDIYKSLRENKIEWLLNNNKKITFIE